MSAAQYAGKSRLANRCLKHSISVILALLALLALGACAPRERRAPSAEDATADSIHVKATAISAIPVRAHRELREKSAAVMSRSQPGVLFTITDSGNEPIVFALDTAGNDRGAWVLRGTRNVDWEAAALGPCGPGARDEMERPGGAGPVQPESLETEPRTTAATLSGCLYIGDVGDNGASLPYRVIYRVAEPRVTDAGKTDTLSVERLMFRYSDGPHDVEAIWVGADGTTWLTTKRRLKGIDGTNRPALVFSLPAQAWQHADSIATASLRDSIDVVPGSVNGRLITDAALSPDGRRLAIRTYRDVFIFDADSLTGAVANRAARFVCDITALRERQGEGITWLGNTGRLLLLSEGNRSPMHVVACGSP